MLKHLPPPPPRHDQLSVKIPYGLVVRIRRSHRRGPGSIPGMGICYFFIIIIFIFTITKNNQPYFPS